MWGPATIGLLPPPRQGAQLAVPLAMASGAVRFEAIILPEHCVRGLRREPSVASARGRLEDRVEALCSREVMAAGRGAIPGGARVRGSVVEVDRGGKVK